MQHTHAPEGRLDLRVGDVVEVRSPAEIMSTLDEHGELDSLPFMPEMLKYCGRRLTVYKVAHKTCDTLHQTGLRRMDNAVHLSGARCDGGGHDGCQAACLIFWKRAWLRKVDPAEGLAPTESQDAPGLLPLLTITSRRPPAEDGAELHRCQATELLRAASQPLPFRDLGQFAEDIRVGNAGPAGTARAILVALFDRAQGFSVRHLPPWLRWRGGLQWRQLRGTATKTPTVDSGLQPGDLVRIRSRKEIAATLNTDRLNRGMGFDSEMGRYCGRTARVARRVDHIIDERTGRMLRMRNPCIVLEGLVCEGVYHSNCPRAITPYWREIWLEKIDENAAGPMALGQPLMRAAE